MNITRSSDANSSWKSFSSGFFSMAEDQSKVDDITKTNPDRHFLKKFVKLVRTYEAL